MTIKNPLDEESADIGALEQEAAKQPPVADAQPKPDAKPEGPPNPIDVDDDPDAEGNQGQFVRREALRQEREARKAVAKELKDLQSRHAMELSTANTRLTQILSSIQQQAQRQPAVAPQQQVQAPPDKFQDPIAYYDHKVNELEATIKRLSEGQGSIQKQTEEQTRIRAIQAEVSRQESEFAAQTPDYGDARAALENSWLAEARAAGVPDHQVPQFIASRTWEVIAHAAQMNRNPAEIAYALAGARGYTKAQQQQQQAQLQRQAAGPSIETLQRGMATVRSSNMTQGGQDDAAGIKALLAMNDSDFANAISNGKWEKLKDKLATRGTF